MRRGNYRPVFQVALFIPSVYLLSAYCGFITSGFNRFNHNKAEDQINLTKSSNLFEQAIPLRSPSTSTITSIASSSNVTVQPTFTFSLTQTVTSSQKYPENLGNEFDTQPTLPKIIENSTIKLPSASNPENYWSYQENLNSGIRGPSNQSAQTYWRYPPQNWGNIPGYELCSKGKNQSPINFSDPFHPTDQPIILRFHYIHSSVKLISNEFSFQMDIPPGNNLLIDDVPYELITITFHSPSEHYLKNRQYDFEVQLRHQNQNGEQAIVSILFSKGKTNKALKPIFENMPPPPYNWGEIADYNPIFIIPSKTDVMTYRGSLSTPPCSEGILWMIFTSPSDIEPAQLAMYHHFFPSNARPLQPLNKREISSGIVGY